MESEHAKTTAGVQGANTGTGTATASQKSASAYPYHKGNRPGRKTKSQEEMEIRIEFTAHLVGQRIFKGEIKKILKQRYGVSSRMTENYISRARKLLVKKSGKSQEAHRSDSYSFYLSTFTHPQATLRDKLWAQQRIDALYGLESHTVRHEGSADNPIAHTMTQIAIDPVGLIEKARALTKEAEEARARSNAITVDVKPSVPAERGDERRTDSTGVAEAVDTGVQAEAVQEKS